MPWNDTLKFYDLETAKKLHYMELSNKIDARLGEKFVKALPLRVTMAILTGGTSLLFSGGRQAYQCIKKSNACDAVRDFVDTERSSRGCTHIEWNSFPESHIVIGGSRMEPTGESVKCPLCRRFEMRTFVADNTHEIMSCGHCSRVIAVKVSRYNRSPQEVLIPGLFAAAIPFTGAIENLGDIVVDMGDLFADVAGFAADIFA